MKPANSKLKIGLVTGEFPPMEGGVGAFTKELAIALYEQGHEVHIVTSRLARAEPIKRSFWQPHEPIQLSYADLYPRVNRWWWAAVNQVANVAVESDLDVVNIQYQASAYDMRVPAVNFLPWRLREVATTIVTFHDLRVPYLFPKAGSLRTWVVRQLAKSAEGVIVTNGEDQQNLLDSGLNSQLIEQIPIGSNVKAIPTSAETVRKVRQKLGLGDGDCLLGYFGFVNVSKGPDLLLAALGQLDANYHVVFAGASTGSSDPINNRAFLQRIEAQVVDAGLETRVHWTGFLSDQDLSSYLQACDLMVMPYRDGVSLRRGTLMAILANGRPLITTSANEPIPQLEHGRNVWLTPVDDVDALRQAILSLSADKDRQVGMAAEARKLAEQFSWDKIARRTTDFMWRIIDQQE